MKRKGTRFAFEVAVGNSCIGSYNWSCNYYNEDTFLRFIFCSNDSLKFKF